MRDEHRRPDAIEQRDERIGDRLEVVVKIADALTAELIESRLRKLRTLEVRPGLRAQAETHEQIFVTEA